MAEPRPGLLLVAVQGVAVLVLAGWWSLQPLPKRLAMLARVQQQEHLQGPVPLAMDDQAAWLVRQRTPRLQGLTGLVGVALLVGVAEGVARRRRAQYGGFLLRAWTLGVVLLPLVLGGAVSVLVLPWPLAQGWVGVGLAAGVGVMGWALASGRPWIP